MCGIVGIVTRENPEAMAGALGRMVSAVRHRGPDAEGVWSARVGERGVALGHTRLAILDRSELGRQPMFLADRSHGVIYNGEVYNYRELRSELRDRGVEFHTESDTEVVLQALATWGDEAFARFNGMWALAWLDQRRRRLVLSRDQFGIKPLYYYRDSLGRLFFASEIKAILNGAGGRFPINPAVAGRYLEQSLLDAQDESFFEGVKALPAGHNLVCGLDDEVRNEPARSYCSLSRPRGEPHLERLIEEVRATFIDAVRIRLRSDVPVGVLLSGGVDSSSIAAVMRLALGAQADLHALSVSSDDPRYDESPFVAEVARHLGCPVQYVKLRPEPAGWFRRLSEMVYRNDEPVGNFSAVAHSLLMERARDLGITVILSGQGADELLCGYAKFVGFYVNELVREGRLPAAVRTLSGFIARGTVLRQFQLSEAKRYLPRLLRPRMIDIRGPRLRDDGYRLDVSLGAGALLERQRADLYRFSVPALVHYEDRSSMAFAREIRLPFLDPRLVAMLLPLDPEYKLRAGWTKWIFRKALEPYLPPSIIWRKDKQGFATPQSEWLKHELRKETEEMLDGEMLTARHGLIDQPALRRRYEAYRRQAPNRGSIGFKDIFNPIAMELWTRRFANYLQAA